MINGNKKEIIKKWYLALSFPTEYDKAFYCALDSFCPEGDITVEGYDIGCEDGVKNLLSALYMCEEAARRHRALGIPEEITLDTLRDIVIWTNTWSSVKGELALFELDWLSLHLGAKIFRLGRLQFAYAAAKHDIPAHGVKAGDPVIEVHIPEGGRLSPEACDESFARAREFFKKYFPHHDYKCFTCHSWLLDPTLEKYLPEESAILAFGKRFSPVELGEVSYALIKYIFTWDTTRENIADKEARSSLAKAIKAATLAGEPFYEALGAIAR